MNLTVTLNVFLFQSVQCVEKKIPIYNDWIPVQYQYSLITYIVCVFHDMHIMHLHVFVYNFSGRHIIATCDKEKTIILIVYIILNPISTTELLNHNSRKYFSSHTHTHVLLNGSLSNNYYWHAENVATTLQCIQRILYIISCAAHRRYIIYCYYTHYNNTHIFTVNSQLQQEKKKRINKIGQRITI